MKAYLYGAIALIWICTVAAAGFAGYRAGANAQAVGDQRLFDAINAKLTEQKATAARIMQAAVEANESLLAARDELKTQLEKEHAQNAANTAALRDKYAGVGLRFKSAEGSGCGLGGAGAVPPSAVSAVPAGAAECVVSSQASSDLRKLAYDADVLADSYRTCYSYVQHAK